MYCCSSVDTNNFYQSLDTFIVHTQFSPTILLVARNFLLSSTYLKTRNILVRGNPRKLAISDILESALLAPTNHVSFKPHFSSCIGKMKNSLLLLAKSKIFSKCPVYYSSAYASYGRAESSLKSGHNILAIQCIRRRASEIDHENH